MSVRCSAVRADQALQSLASAVRTAQTDGPLTPVSVLVPTNAVGVTARRWLGANGGVAAIEFVTPARLAERLAGAELAAGGRLPISTPLLDITVRAVLDAVPGMYGEVADHVSTVTSLRDLHRELRLAGPDAAERLARTSKRGAEAARVSSMVGERLTSGWYDEADLLTAAISTLRSGPSTALADRTIAFLPRLDRGLAVDLLAAVGVHHHLDVIVEMTGIGAVDADAAELVGQFGERVDAPQPTSFPDHVEFVSTTDADEELRAAVRVLVDAARAGTPFARMAIVWPIDRPYARLAEHHLDAAGIPWNGRPGTLVTERLVPRFLLDLLGLDRRGLRRDDLFDFLADVPVLDPAGGRVSVARWERLARSAGVTRGDHWAPRLAALAASLRSGDAPRDDAADSADELARFVSDLRRDLGPYDRTRSWAEWADWCERQVQRRLGPGLLDQLDEAERLASDHTSRVIDRLRHLDGVSRAVTRRAFRAAFAAEFEVAPGRLGRLGNGVAIGSLTGTAGLDTDLTILVGAADGLLPPAPRIDPLVTDHDRRAAGLAAADSRTHRAHRSFLAHLTTSTRIVVSVPRGDLRATTERQPCRWLAPHVTAERIRSVASHHRGVLDAPFPSTATEFRLRARAAAATDGAEALATACRDDEAAERALAMRAARRSDRITVYDGDLTGVDIDHFARPVSASRIEAWPACPHAYFVRHLLGVRPIDEAGDEFALTPIERGNVVHHTLDRFHRLVVSGDLPQPGPTGWSAEHVTALSAIYDETADEFDRTGRTGRPAHWFLDRQAVRRDLLTWFEHDGATAAARGARVVHSELRFGYDDTVTLPLPDGRLLPVAGFVDRVDEVPGGLVVMDHKSGGDDRYKGITSADPTEGATKFQLPVYAAAALAASGSAVGVDEIAVRAEYDFFGSASYARHGYTLDADVWARVTADLGHVVAGIESGLYPNVTEPPQYEHRIGCHYCQPDGLGVDERYREWVAKRVDPRIAAWFPPDDDQPPASDEGATDGR